MLRFHLGQQQKRCIYRILCLIKRRWFTHTTRCVLVLWACFMIMCIVFFASIYNYPIVVSSMISSSNNNGNSININQQHQSKQQNSMEEFDYSNRPFMKNKRAPVLYELQNKHQPIEWMVTVITTFYSSRVFSIRESVMNQTYQQIQWKVVNDGSTRYLHHLHALYTTRFYQEGQLEIINLKYNIGLPAARNIAISKTFTPYVLFLDCDDYIEPTYIEKALWVFQSAQLIHQKQQQQQQEQGKMFSLAMVNAWSVGFGYKEYLWSHGFHDGVRNRNENMITVALMMRTDVLKEVGMFDSSLKQGMEDWDLWLRTLHYNYTGYTIREYLYWYRVSPPGKWQAIDNKIQFEQFKQNMHQKYHDPREYSSSLVLQVPKHSLVPSPFDFLLSFSFSSSNVLYKPKETKRVLLLVPFAKIGGSEQFVLQLLKGLAELTSSSSSSLTWEFVVAFLKTDPQEEQLISEMKKYTEDLFVLHNFLPTIHYPAFLLYLIQSRQIDLVFISNTEEGYLYLPYLRYYTQKSPHLSHVKFVDYCHSEEPTWKLGGYPRYAIQYAPLLDRTLVASEYLKTWIVQQQQQQQQQYKINMDVVHLGVDITNNPNNNNNNNNNTNDSPDSMMVEDLQQMIREKSLNNNTLVVFYVARLDKLKQPFLVLQTFDYLLRRLSHFNFLCVMIGTGPLQSELESTFERASALPDNLKKRILYLKHLPNNVVQQLLPMGHVMFLPSKREGISLSVMEGMMHGLVPLTTNVGGQSELIKNYDNGFLVDLTSLSSSPSSVTLINNNEEDQDAIQFANILAYLIQYPSLRCLLGERARQTIYAYWTMSHMIQRMEQTLLSVLQSQSPSQHETNSNVVKDVSQLLMLEQMRTNIEFIRTQNELNNIWNHYQSSKKQSNQIPTTDAIIQPQQIVWQNGIVLLGSSYPTNISSQYFNRKRNNKSVYFPLTLLWSTQTGPTLNPLKIFVHFRIKGQEHIEQNVFQVDHYPVYIDFTHHSTQWHVGQVIIDKKMVHVPKYVKQMKLQEVSILIGLFEEASGKRISIVSTSSSSSSSSHTKKTNDMTSIVIGQLLFV